MLCLGYFYFHFYFIAILYFILTFSFFYYPSGSLHIYYSNMICCYHIAENVKKMISVYISTYCDIQGAIFLYLFCPIAMCFVFYFILFYFVLL